jgi:hypothetical protein
MMATLSSLQAELRVANDALVSPYGNKELQNFAVFCIEQKISDLQAVSLPQPAPTLLVDVQPVAVQELALSEQSKQSNAKGFIQISIEFVSDFFQNSVKKRAKTSKRSNTSDSSEFVQTNLFELLRPYAEKELNKIKALFEQYAKDLQELRNPFSRLSKILAKKRDAKLASLSETFQSLRKDIAEFSFMWGFSLSPTSAGVV